MFIYCHQCGGDTGHLPWCDCHGRRDRSVKIGATARAYTKQKTTPADYAEKGESAEAAVAGREPHAEHAAEDRGGGERLGSRLPAERDGVRRSRGEARR